MKIQFANKFALIALLLASASSVMTANASTIKVYKSTGPHGEIRYSQSLPRDAKNVEIIEFRSDGRQNTAGTQAAPTVDPQAAEQQNRLAQAEQQIKDLQDRENAQRCQSLRNNLANLNIGGRIYEMDANGNRVFLNAQEIESKRARTQQALSQYCGGK